MRRIDIDSKPFLSNLGYGHGSNYTTDLVASLMLQYADAVVKKLTIPVVINSVCPKCGCNKITGDGTKSWCLNSECDFIEAD